jgi:DNA damage-binding protein 1
MSNITAFRNESFENCIAFTTSSGVMIGQIDQVQKLHINKIPLGETARRICHQEYSRTFGILTSKMEADFSSTKSQSSFKILDDQSFESKMWSGYKIESWMETNCHFLCSVA